MQRFLDLGVLAGEGLWSRLIETFLSVHIAKTSTVSVAIDRTGWGHYNLLMVSLIWRKRAIPVAWIRLDKLGSTNHDEQTTVLSNALSYLADYTVVVLGDREFCSVDLARWLGEQNAYFCLRLKASTLIQTTDDSWCSLSALGLTPGTQVFFNQVSVTKTKGFGEGRVVGKWKRRYRGFAPDEPWFILTNLNSLDEAIKSYQKRFSIEQMFRDWKSGGYCLESCRLEGKRFMTMVLLVAIAYLCATTQGQRLKHKALQHYIARPESIQGTHKRHSAFHIGLAAHRWIPFWFSCQQHVQTLMMLNRNKIADYLRGLKAIDAVLATL